MQGQRRGEPCTFESMAGPLSTVSDELFAPDATHGLSLALVVMVDGEVIHERYGHQPDTIFGPGSPVDRDTRLVSWSMAKSMLHAACGALVADGRLDLGAPALGDITYLDLLEMRPGLHWVEDYEDDGSSNCLEMLFGAGAHDMAAYAASQPRVAPRGTVWNYSSGTSNILSRALGEIVGGGRAGMERFLAERVFGPAGMTSAVATFDDAGTFVGSSYVHATALDFANFGEWYRANHDGRHDAGDGDDRLPDGWFEHARTFVAADPDNGLHYGRHWWMFPDLPGSIAACGYEGQFVLVVPDQRLTVVHLGKTPATHVDGLRDQVRRVVQAVA